MGHLEIKSWTGEVLYAGEADDLQELVEKAVKAGADLSRASLSGADLSGAKLSGANLSGAKLSGANLYGADLSMADLSRAQLSGADLSRADLPGANLSRANFSGANLYRAYLSRASLSGANLTGANLSGADLLNVKDADITLARLNITPEGSIIGWKKCRNNVVVKLRIPEEARRSNAYGRKCRAEFVDVLDVIGAGVGISCHDGKTEYRVGQRVTCDRWDNDRFNECSGGIHFYLTREEAEVHI